MATGIPRTSFRKAFGPGLMWAAAAIGISHLVQSTRAGAMAGFGLAGVVRAVSHPELRVMEAARLGCNRCLLPAGNLKTLDKPDGVQLVGVRSATEALEDLFR